MRPRAAVVVPALAVLLSGATCGQEDIKPPVPVAPVEPLVSAPVAEAVALAIAAQDGAAVDPWLREGVPVLVRTDCASCPPEARWRVEVLADRASARVFASRLVVPRAARDAEPPIMALRWGEPTCEGTCCAFPTALVDHATLYLTRLCFGADRQGVWLVQLDLLDGS